MTKIVWPTKLGSPWRLDGDTWRLSPVEDDAHATVALSVPTEDTYADDDLTPEQRERLDNSAEWAEFVAVEVDHYVKRAVELDL